MTVPANDSLRITEECWKRCAEGRFDLASELMREDFVHDDRRRGLSNTLINRTDTLSNNGVLVEMGFSPRFEPLVVDANKLSVCRVVFEDRGGNEVAAIQVLGIDDAGLRAFCISFDDDAVELARAEFERRR